MSSYFCLFSTHQGVQGLYNVIFPQQWLIKTSIYRLFLSSQFAQDKEKSQKSHESVTVQNDEDSQFDVFMKIASKNNSKGTSFVSSLCLPFIEKLIQNILHHSNCGIHSTVVVVFIVYKVSGYN